MDHGYLLAYEKNTEFFVRYVKKTGEWEPVGISFSNFRHDYHFKEIQRDEAFESTCGSLPEEAYLNYIDMINRNRGL